MPLAVSVSQLLDEHHEGRMQDVHTAIPGKIVSWATSGLATVQPTVRKPLTSTDGFIVYETPPEIKNVPCYIMAAGGFLISMPYAEGDPVMLIFSEQAYAEYLANGEISNPKDIRRHGTGYPYAIPGPRPAPKALSSVDGSSLIIGKDGDAAATLKVSAGLISAGNSGTEQFVALENLVHAELVKIQSSISAGCSTITGLPNLAYLPGSVASSNLKAKP